MRSPSTISVPKAADREIRILGSIIKPNDRTLPVAAARAILKLDFDEGDRRRMHELAAKNQEDSLSAVERADLDAYVHAGLVLDLLHTKAKLSLKRR